MEVDKIDLNFVEKHGEPARASIFVKRVIVEAIIRKWEDCGGNRERAGSRKACRRGRLEGRQNQHDGHALSGVQRLRFGMIVKKSISNIWYVRRECNSICPDDFYLLRLIIVEYHLWEKFYRISGDTIYVFLIQRGRLLKHSIKFIY